MQRTSKPGLVCRIRRCAGRHRRYLGSLLRFFTFFGPVPDRCALLTCVCGLLISAHFCAQFAWIFALAVDPSVPQGPAVAGQRQQSGHRTRLAGRAHVRLRLPHAEQHRHGQAGGGNLPVGAQISLHLCDLLRAQLPLHMGAKDLLRRGSLALFINVRYNRY